MLILAFLVKTIFLLLCVILLYLFLSIVSIYIPVNKRFETPENGINIFLSSDGIHTDFIFPVQNGTYNWKKMFNSSDFNLGMQGHNYVSIGWGDKGFYLDIPTWNDLTFKVAFKAMCVPSPTLMQVKEVEVLPKEKKNFVELRLSEENYLNLCNYIASYFCTLNDIPVILEGKGYTENDNFYYSDAKYHAFQTCNSWVVKALIVAGVRTSIWSPSAKGIFYQLDLVKTKKTS